MDLTDRAELAGLARVAAAVSEAAHPASSMLIGAAARDLVYAYGHGLDFARVTIDADFVLSVADWGEYDSVRRRLVERHGMHQDPQRGHRLTGSIGKVDLLPCGGIEHPSRTVAWPAPATEILNVLGLREAFGSAVVTKLPGGVSVTVCAPAVQILLKLIAWEDRHAAWPRTDSTDLLYLLRFYEEAEGNERHWTEHRHLLHQPGFDPDLFGAWLAGRDAAAFLAEAVGEPERVLLTVTHILRRECDPDRSTALVAEGTGFGGEARRLLLLRNFLGGITGKQELAIRG